MRNFTWNRFPSKLLLIDSLLSPIVESTYLNRDMWKFESSQKDESRWQSTDSSKAYRNTNAFKCQSYQSNRSNQTRGSGQWTTVKEGGVVLFFHQRVTPTKQIIGWSAGSVFRSSAYTLFRRAMAQHIPFPYVTVGNKFLTLLWIRKKRFFKFS